MEQKTKEHMHTHAATWDEAKAIEVIRASIKLGNDMRLVAGSHLYQAKRGFEDGAERLKRGNFGDWCTKNFGDLASLRSMQRWMDLHIANLGAKNDVASLIAPIQKEIEKIKADPTIKDKGRKITALEAQIEEIKRKSAPPTLHDSHVQVYNRYLKSAAFAKEQAQEALAKAKAKEAADRLRQKHNEEHFERVKENEAREAQRKAEAEAKWKREQQARDKTFDDFAERLKSFERMSKLRQNNPIDRAVDSLLATPEGQKHLKRFLNSMFHPDSPKYKANNELLASINNFFDKL